MARTSVEDPLKGFNFLVEIDGMARAGFMECSGLEATTEVVKYREGGDNTTPKKSAGLTDFANITLKRGVVLDEGQNDLYNWYLETFSASGNGASARDYRRTIDVVLREKGGLPAVRWRCHEAWAARFKGTGDLNALGSDNIIEELEVAFEGFEKIAV